MSLTETPTAPPEHLLARAVPGAIFSFIFLLDLRQLARGPLHPSIELAGHFVYVVFIGMIVLLTVVRGEATAIDRRPLPTVATAIGTFGLVFSPLLFNSGGHRLFALGAVGSDLESALVAVALLGALVSLASLGRAFSLTPQASHLVVRGPYRVVRNPLYCCEGLAMFGLVLADARVTTLAVTAVVIGSQLVRIRYEEELLRSVFPGYDEAFAGVARLIPGIY